MAIKDLVPWKKSDKNVLVRREDDPFYAFRQEMDHVFDDFFGGGLIPFSGFMDRSSTFQPRVDVAESEHEITVTAELPGLAEKDVEVSLTSDALTISGEKKAEKEDKGENYYRLERSYGSFQRSIPLPVEVEADKVEATFKNGVLHVTMPKLHPKESAKKITVKTS